MFLLNDPAASGLVSFLISSHMLAGAVRWGKSAFFHLSSSLFFLTFGLQSCIEPFYANVFLCNHSPCGSVHTKWNVSTDTASTYTVCPPLQTAAAELRRQCDILATRKRMLLQNA